MQAPSHCGFALSGSVFLNNALYSLIPAPLPHGWDYLMHAAASPVKYPAFLRVMQLTPLLTATLTDTTFWLILLQKMTFYGVLLYFATWSDRSEYYIDEKGVARRRDHRGLTHSLMFLFCLAVLSIGAYVLALNYTFMNTAPWTIILLREVGTALTAFFLAVVLHIVADLLTTQGVKLSWPEEKMQSPVPKALRFNNDTWPEYAIIWGSFFAAGGLFFLGILGV